MGGKGLGNDAPDAGRSGGDEDTQARLHASVYWVGHGLFSAPLAPDRYLLWARIIWDAKSCYAELPVILRNVAQAPPQYPTQRLRTGSRP